MVRSTSAGAVDDSNLHANPAWTMHPVARKRINDVAWNLDGSRFAVCSSDKTVRVHPLSEGTSTRRDMELSGHSDNVNSVVWSPDNANQVASVSDDNSMRVWDARSGKLVCRIPTIGANLNAAWHPEGHVVAIGNRDDTMSWFDLRTQGALNQVHFPFEVNHFAWDASGAHLFLSSNTGAIEVLKWPGCENVRSIIASSGQIFSLAVDQSGCNRLAAGGAESCVSVWDVERLIPLYTMERLEWPVSSISFSSGCKLIAAACENKNIDVFRAETGEAVASMALQHRITRLAWSPRDLLLAVVGEETAYDAKSSSDRCAVRLYNMREQSRVEAAAADSAPSLTSAVALSAAPEPYHSHHRGGGGGQRGYAGGPGGGFATGARGYR